MRIWDSQPLMTAIDLIIVAAALLAVGFIRSRRRDLRTLGLSGPTVVSAGLLLMASTFLLDLLAMWVLPLFTPMARAMQVLLDLHRSWSWLLMLVAAATISAGVIATVRDLRRADRRLAQQEGLFQEILATLTDFVVRWKPDGTRTYVNEAYCRFFEQPAEVLVGTSFMPLVAPEDRELIERKIAALSPAQPSSTMTHRAVRPDGTLSWQEWTDRGFFDADGTLLELQSVGRDVSERRRAEEALRASEERYRAVFNSTTSGLVVRRLSDGRLVELNPTMAGFHGYSPAEMVTMPMEEYVPADSLADFREHLELLRRGEKCATKGQGIHRDGHLFDLEGLFVPFEYRGEPHVLGVLNDVTERNRAERALRASERKFSQAFEASPDSIVITSLTDGRLIEVNQGFVDASGLSREEAVGRTSEELGLWQEPEIREEILAAWKRGETVGPREVVLKNPAGERRVVELRAAAFETDGEPRLLTAARDISDRRRAEDALRERLRFERLISDVSTRFVDVAAEALDAEIDGLLERLVRSLGIDRCSVVQRSSDSAWPLTHSFALGGQALASFDLRELPWIFGQVLRGEVVAITGDADLPAEAQAERRFSAERGTLSVAVIPLEVGGKVLGAMTFAALRRARRWPERVLQGLGLVADMLANALARRRADAEVHSSELRYQKALEEAERLKQELEQERDYLREEVSLAGRFGDIVGESAALERVLARIEAVAATNANVLIQGESGVGKELVARAIHARSNRSAAPLVRVNCPAVPRELFESEFFGHVKGAFTGAHRDRIGRFQLAHGGTIFLDEVSEIPLELQAKLLRVLQEGEFQRVGEETTHKVDVRVIAATNRGLRLEMHAGRFREDLYYRLSVFPIEVPPLRQRREDLLPLAQHFVQRACRQMRRPELPISQFQGRQIVEHDWPGNVRELQNVIEQAVILSPGSRLRLDLALPGASRAPEVETPDATEMDEVAEPLFVTAAELKRRERDNLVAALRHAEWKISGPGGAAELLGIKPSTLSYQMKALEIEKE